MAFIFRVLDELPSDQLNEDQLNQLYWSIELVFEDTKTPLYFREFGASSGSARRIEEAGRRVQEREPLRKLMTYAELSHAWEMSDVSTRELRYFSENATDDEFLKAARAIPVGDERANFYVRCLFDRRSYPGDIQQIFALARQKSNRISSAAFAVLKNLESAEVRRFGLKQLRTKYNGSWAADLLIKNYRPGDDERIRRRSEQSWNRIDCHQTLLSLLRLVEAHPEIDPAYTDYLYDQVPCCTCRYGVVKLLIAKGRFSEIAVSECLQDADEAIRKLAVKHSNLPGTRGRKTREA